MSLIAQSIQQTIGQVTPPPELQNLTSKGGAGGINFILATAVKIIFEVGAVGAVFMLLIGSVQWILSGGDKEKVAEARKRIMWAIIGMTFLALSFLILTVLGKILGTTIVGSPLDSGLVNSGSGCSPAC